MRTVRVADPADPRVRDFVGLTDVAARTVREPAEGLFIAEGAKVILRALANGYAPRAVLTEQRWLPSLGPALDDHDLDVLVAGPDVLRAVTGYRVHRGALASMQRRPLPEPAEVLRGARLVAVLVDLVDHANVGAIFRNAAALGVDGVLVTGGCADPLYRRSIKVSMGAVLSLPWSRLPGPGSAASPPGRPPGWLRLLADAGFESLALSPAVGGVPIADLTAGSRPRALLLGTEGEGLAREVLEGVDLRVRIPMAAGVDSLNVAAASAIAFHVLAARASAGGRGGRHDGSG